MAKFEVRDGFLFRDGEQVPHVPSPNRSGRIVPRSIVEHDTAGPSVASAVNWFAQRRAKASAHVVIGRDGEIVQCVPFDMAAWHAGRSAWKGRNGLNGDSIGIEMVAPGKLVKSGTCLKSWWGQTYPIEGAQLIANKTHGRGWWIGYTKEQIDTNAKVVEALCKAYPTIEEVIGHYHISPGRKIDPAPTFQFIVPRNALAKAAAPAGKDHVTDRERIAGVQEILGQLGYGAGPADGFIGPRTESAIWAFQKQNGIAPTGELDHETAHFIESRKGERVAFPNGAREQTTEAEIVQTSRIAKEGAGDKREGVALLGLGGTVAAASQVQGASNVLSSLVQTWGWTGVLLTIAAVLLWLGWRRYRKGIRIIWYRLMDHRTGRHVGGPVERQEA